MKQISVVKSVLKFAPLALAVSCSLILLSGCGSSNSAAPANATISGTIVAAPVSGADISVVDVDGLLVAETEKTDAAGKYTDLVIPGGSLAKDLIVKSTGGAFIDEATGNDGIADEMMAYVAASTLSNGDSVSVTPGSTIVADLVMNHGKSLAEAETAFFAGFGYKPDISVTPVDATVVAVDASDEAKLAGLRAAAFSQLAKGLGLSQNDQFKMFTALAQDLSDGKLNGLMGTEAIEIVSPTEGTITLPDDMLKRSTNSLLAFQTSSNSEMDLTSTYRIEYVPGMMPAMAGKSMFTIKITNRSDDSPVAGLNPMVMPIMHMVSHEHTTPLTDITDIGGGEYSVTIYYLMPSMMEGASMGTWDLAVTVEDETVHFYPGVMMMPEADTPLVRLKGVDDKVTNMDGLLASRVYTIFRDNLKVNPGADQFTVFVVAQETMMSFPAVFVGSELSGKILADVTVQMFDGTNWHDASHDGDGMWTANGLDLTEVPGEKDEIRVRLTVDDTVINEVKTTDGKAVDPDVNDFNTFTVTPVTAAMM